jgi:hypothetical protein
VWERSERALQGDQLARVPPPKLTVLSTLHQITLTMAIKTRGEVWAGGIGTEAGVEGQSSFDGPSALQHRRTRSFPHRGLSEPNHVHPCCLVIPINVYCSTHSTVI